MRRQQLVVACVLLLIVGLGGCVATKQEAKPASAAEQGLPAPEILATNEKAFSAVPHRGIFSWNAVPGAVSYKVEVDCFHCCDYNKWCEDLGKTLDKPISVEKTSYEFKFVGQQSHRWRVWAVDANKKEGAKTDWWEVTYQK